MIGISWSLTGELAMHPVQELRTGVRQIASHLHEGLCALRGHQWALQIGDHRLYLRCLSCDRETDGWRIDDPPRPVTPSSWKTTMARPTSQRH